MSVNLTHTLASGGHDAALAPPFHLDNTSDGHQRLPFTPTAGNLRHARGGSHAREQSMLSVNQKLDRMLSLALEQNAAIQKGQVETAELRKHIESVSRSVDEVKRRVDEFKTGASGRLGPKDLSVSRTFNVMFPPHFPVYVNINIFCFTYGDYGWR